MHDRGLVLCCVSMTPTKRRAIKRAMHRSEDMKFFCVGPPEFSTSDKTRRKVVIARQKKSKNADCCAEQQQQQ